jgi:hypothetical protein
VLPPRAKRSVAKKVGSLTRLGAERGIKTTKIGFLGSALRVRLTQSNIVVRFLEHAGYLC